MAANWIVSDYIYEKSPHPQKILRETYLRWLDIIKKHVEIETIEA